MGEIEQTNVVLSSLLFGNYAANFLSAAQSEKNSVVVEGELRCNKLLVSKSSPEITLGFVQY